MTLDQLKAFVTIVRTHSFTRAADALNSSKAHMSRVVTVLEQELGVKLLMRSTRSLALTEIGREVFERAVGILAAVEETERVAHRSLGAPRGMLRLTCGAEFGMLAVSGWIASYCGLYPEVSVEAHFTPRLVDVIHEGFDLAIRIGPLAETRLAARPLGELRYALYASRGYLKREGTPRAPADLKAHRLLAFAGGRHRGGITLHRGSVTEKIEGPARIRVDNVFALRDAALAGLGVAQLPEIVARAAPPGRLQRVLPDWAPASVPVNAVFPSNRYLTPKVRAFIDHAVALFPRHEILDHVHRC
jgi:DNA-binding transcriptional LysR family regulator